MYFKFPSFFHGGSMVNCLPGIHNCKKKITTFSTVSLLIMMIALGNLRLWVIAVSKVLFDNQYNL